MRTCDAVLMERLLRSVQNIEREMAALRKRFENTG
jgi:hypothetical protein